MPIEALVHHVHSTRSHYPFGANSANSGLAQRWYGMHLGLAAPPNQSVLHVVDEYLGLCWLKLRELLLLDLRTNLCQQHTCCIWQAHACGCAG